MSMYTKKRDWKYRHQSIKSGIISIIGVLYFFTNLHLKIYVLICTIKQNTILISSEKTYLLAFLPHPFEGLLNSVVFL